WFRPQMEESAYSPFDDLMEDMKRAGRHEMPSVELMTERWVEERKTDEAVDD
ncbi:MAG: hypothetical protein IIC29_09050, partial [Chloroflexi bacterium]|nr:hypothetical protein [Chloroflexota bacterium]